MCGSVGPDILFHLGGECQYTRQQVIGFINFVDTRFGVEIAYELSSCPISDFLVKLLGLSFLLG